MQMNKNRLKRKPITKLNLTGENKEGEKIYFLKTRLIIYDITAFSYFQMKAYYFGSSKLQFSQVVLMSGLIVQSSARNIPSRI